jgi:hypothetical protein
MKEIIEDLILHGYTKPEAIKICKDIAIEAYLFRVRMENETTTFKHFSNWFEFQCK